MNTKQKPYTTSQREQELNVENGLRVSRVIAVIAAWLLLALVGCVGFVIVVSIWEYLVLGK